MARALTAAISLSGLVLVSTFVPEPASAQSGSAFICYAQSARGGQRFSAIGRSPGATQRQAVSACQTAAWAQCRAMGCRREVTQAAPVRVPGVDISVGIGGSSRHDRHHRSHQGSEREVRGWQREYDARSGGAGMGGVSIGW